MLWCVKTGLISGKTAETIAPLETITAAEAALILQRAELLPAESVMKRDLDTLSALHRPIGSEGEQAAVRYLKKRFSEMGYEVVLQPYTDEKGRTGSNVIARRAAKTNDADILVFSAHHDSVPTAYGANYFHEDIADTFALFLLSDKPAGSTVAEEKIRFFWSDKDLVALRADIRENLGLS